MAEEFDEDTFRRMRSYCGGDPRVPRRVSATAFSEYGEQTWSVDEFLSAITEAIGAVPADSRDSAEVELSGGYDETTRLTITYARLQTPEEVADSVNRALAYARERQAEERATYKALKAKFEPPSEQ